jgi:dTMP kinase
MAKLIGFSAVDGAGKTTMLKYMIEKLQVAGFRVLDTREVGNPHIPVCVKLRELVLDPNSDLDGAEMEMIFAAMRLRNHRMYKAIDSEYDFIVSDRDYLDHLAYTDHNVNKDFTNKLYTDFIGKMTKMPDVVLYLSVNTDTALKRRVKRGEGMDAIELKGVGFQEKVRQSFEQHLETLPSSTEIFKVDANQSQDQVKEQISLIINKLIEQHA